jgi:hypothetical protein
MKPVIISAVILALATSFGHAQESVGVASSPVAMPTLRITSPLGRTGAPATVRIVAQVQWQGDASGHVRPLHLRFLVDGAVVGTVESGPPYAVSWTDENPFESLPIQSADAADDAGTSSETK